MSKTLIKDVGGWSFYSCPCVAEWWPLVQTMALRRGLVRQKLDVSQGGYNRGGVAASAGTHDGGGVLDLRQYSGGVVKLLREAGSAAWHRGAPHFADHTHLVLVGCPHASAGAKRQVASYLAGRDGLAMNGPDNGPQVRIRTWREGVAWMRSQLTPTADGPTTTPDSPAVGTPTTTPTDEELIMANIDDLIGAINGLAAKQGADQSASDAYAVKLAAKTGEYVHAYLRDKGLTVKLDDETITKLAAAIKNGATL